MSRRSESTSVNASFRRGSSTIVAEVAPIPDSTAGSMVVHVPKVIHFLPEGPILRHIPVVPQIQETSFHDLPMSDLVQGKVPQGLQRLRPSSLPGSVILHRWTTGVPFATTLAQTDAQLRRSLQNDRAKWRLVRCNTALTLLLSYSLTLLLSHSLSCFERPN